MKKLLFAVFLLAIQVTVPSNDPMDYGAVGDGRADDTKFFQAAEATGYVFCAPGRHYSLNRVQIHSFDTIRGVSGVAGEKACELFGRIDAPLVSATPNSYLTGVIIQDIVVRASSNGIDIPFINDLTVERVNFFDPTGCGLVVINGERPHLHYLQGNWTAKNGASLLCTGVVSKSLFAATIPPNPNYGVARGDIIGLYDFGSLPNGFASQWLWYAGDSTGGTVVETTALNLHIGFSGSQGVLQMNACINSDFNIIDLDHVAQGLAPAPVGVNITGPTNFCKFSHYNPGYNANNILTQMFIDNCKACTVENSQFSSTVDNVKTFGLKYGAHSGLLGSIRDSLGGLYVPNLAQQQQINISGSAMSPRNF